MSNQAKTNGHEDHGHFIVPIKFYALNLFALLFFMVLTIWAASWNVGSFGNNIIAMAIAVTKATLVVTIFMGVKWASNLVKLYALLGFVWVFFMAIMFCDYGTRHLEIEKGWEGQEQLRVTGMNAPEIDPVAVEKAHIIGEGGGH